MKTITKTVVVINEQHSLLSDQKKVIEEKFGKMQIDWVLYPIPAKGLTIQEIKKAVSEITGNVIFVSPIPAMIILLAQKRMGYGVFCLHNDNRVAKEIKTPNGVKLIHSVAKTGWQVIGQ